MPFSLGAPELLIVLVILLLIFGAGRVAELGAGLGKSIREFKKARSEAEEERPAQPEAKA